MKMMLTSCSRLGSFEVVLLMMLCAAALAYVDGNRAHSLYHKELGNAPCALLVVGLLATLRSASWWFTPVEATKETAYALVVQRPGELRARCAGDRGESGDGKVDDDAWQFRSSSEVSIALLDDVEESESESESGADNEGGGLPRPPQQLQRMRAESEDWSHGMRPPKLHRRSRSSESKRLPSPRRFSPTPKVRTFERFRS